MRIFAILLSCLIGTACISAHAQGALEPSAPPGPVMKTLDQVEPRTPISTAGTIAAPGSYYLTGNITGLLSVTADDVVLDLQGFTVTASGISALNVTSASNVHIHNGGFREGTSATVVVQDSSNVTLENLKVLASDLNGVRVQEHSGPIVIRSTLVDTAGWSGISVLNTGSESVEAVIEDNIVRNANTETTNTRLGISVAHTGPGDLTATVARNQVFNNRTLGLGVSAEGGGASRGTIFDNAVHGNGSSGLRIDGDFVVFRNISHNNGTNYNFVSAPNAAPVSALASAGPWDNVEQ